MADPDNQRPGELLHGQLLDSQFRVATPYTQQIQTFEQGGQSPNQGAAGYEIVVKDANATEDKHFDYGPLDAAKLAIFDHNPGYTSFSLPRVLLSLTAIFSTSKGVGKGESVPSADSVGTSWAVGVSASNRATSSLDYIPDVVPRFRSYDASNVPSIECYFFTSGSKTLAQVLSILSAGLGASVLAWPTFRPESFSLIKKGQTTSLSSTASVQLSASQNSANTTLSDNGGYDYSIETRSVVSALDIADCLHGTISILNEDGSSTGNPYTKSDTISVTASSTITITGSIPTTTVTGGTTVPAQTVTGTISPHTFAATSPTSIPTSGLYLKDIRPTANDGDLFLQLATVVDFAYFA